MIVHLRASNFYGGPERQIHQHARRAHEAGWEIVLASFSERGEMPDLLKTAGNDGLPTHVVDVKSAYDRTSIAKLHDFLRRRKIAVLCTHDYRSNILAFFATRHIDTRWVAFSRGFTRESIKVRLYHLLDKIFMRFADRVVAVSAGEKARLRRWQIPEARIVVVRNAINEEILTAAPAVDLRDRFSLLPDSIVGVAAGRFSPEKGQRYLVQAMAEVIKENPLVRMILFGDGPDLEPTRAYIRQHRLEKYMICPGFEKNLPGCLRDADFLVNPSLSEGLPNIVLEAMALKVPVVATAVGGVPEIIEDGRTGLLVPRADADRLAEAILSIVDDPERSRQLAESGLQFARDSLTFEHQNERLCELYRLLIGK